MWLLVFTLCCIGAYLYAVQGCEATVCLSLACTLSLQEGLENDEQRVGADIIRRALPYALKLIARNAGVNGSVVVQKVGYVSSKPPAVPACGHKIGSDQALSAAGCLLAI